MSEPRVCYHCAGTGEALYSPDSETESVNGRCEPCLGRGIAREVSKLKSNPNALEIAVKAFLRLASPIKPKKKTEQT